MYFTEETIEDLKGNLPKLLSSQDIVELGLYANKSSLRAARKKGDGPPSVLISRRNVKYPRQAVLIWLKEKMEGNN